MLGSVFKKGLSSALSLSKAEEVAHNPRPVRVVVQVGKGHLRLDHPKFEGWRAVLVFSARKWATGVDIVEGRANSSPSSCPLAFQAGLWPKKFLAEIVGRPAAAGVRHPDGPRNNSPAAFAVAGGDNRVCT